METLQTLLVVGGIAALVAVCGFFDAPEERVCPPAVPAADEQDCCPMVYKYARR